MLARLTLPDGSICNLSYEQWGDTHSDRVLFCVHGLTRNALDFEKIGHAASERGYLVIAPDMPGRGKSEWLANSANYNNLVYASLCSQLLGIMNIKHVDWLGTSMGGIVGLIMANQMPTLIQKLVLNDVGCIITAASLARIGEYVGLSPNFVSFAEAEEALRIRTLPFAIPANDWRYFARNSIQQTETGFRLAYDPAIGDVFKTAYPAKDVDLWPLWGAVKLIPTLLIRGQQSDLLTEETAMDMKYAHHMLTRYNVPNAGHAPSLMATHDIVAIIGFLNRYRSLPVRGGLRLLRSISPYNQAVKIKKLAAWIKRK